MKDEHEKATPPPDRGLPEAPASRRRREDAKNLLIAECDCRTLYEEIPLPVFLLDCSWSIVLVNSCGAADLGYSPQQLAGQPFLSLVEESDRTAALQQLAACLRSRARDTRWVLRIVRSGSGTAAWMKAVARPAEAVNGAGCVLLALCDITELKETEEALWESEHRLRALINNIPDIAWLKDREGRFVAVNEACARSSGMRAEELAGKTDDDIWPHEVAEAYRSDDEEVMASGLPKRFEDCVTGKEGGRQWREVIKTPVLNGSGTVIGMTGIARDITERKRAEEILKASEALYRRLFESAKEGILLFSPETGKITQVNPCLAEMLGHTGEELLGKSLEEIGLFADGSLAESALAALKESGYLRYEDIVLTTKEGRAITVDVYLVDSAQEIHCSIRDVTERRRLERALQESERQQRAILNNIPDIAWLKDREGRFVAVNEAFARTFGARPEELAGKTDFDIWPGEKAEKLHADDLKVMTGGRRKRFEDSYQDGEGATRWIDVVKTPVFDEGGTVIGMTGIARDITERKRAEEALRERTYYDALTGLPNRLLLQDRLALELAHAERHGEKLAVLSLDLDAFTSINDVFGHTVGDTVLKRAAERLRAAVRAADTLARMGGDEFTLILPNIAHSEEAARVAQSLLAAFTAPLPADGQEFFVTLSVGISVYPHDGQDAETLLKNADSALTHVKTFGRARYQFYDFEINRRSRDRMRLETNLRRAIGRGELVVHYQPQVDIVTNKMVSSEALVRWNHPERGLLGPEHFISLAEETGLIIPLGEWVLRAVCRQSRQWQEAGYPPLCTTVNLSARQFRQHNFIETVERVLRETGLDPALLELEITESAAMQNMEVTLQRLFRLKDMGVRLAMDDFGTGYSSLAYLKQLPIYKIKIDKAFISGLPSDSDDKTIVQAVVAMANSMALRVNAEGVEREAQLSFLRAVKCDEAQGFLFSRPLPAEEFEALIASDG